MNRISEILIAIVLFVCFFPILLIAMLISFIETGLFPVYMQTRGLSLDKSLFRMYKIRTIKESKNNERENRRRFLICPGIREKVPPICEIIRKLGIDEIPQLLNIIKGEMNLIGPRPLDVYDLKILKNNYPVQNYERAKLKSKPGITGLWQINGNRLSGAENLLYWDKYYEGHKNIKLQFNIIAQSYFLIYNKKKEDSVITFGETLA